MNDDQFDKIMDVLGRIADALEGIAKTANPQWDCQSNARSATVALMPEDWEIKKEYYSARRSGRFISGLTLLGLATLIEDLRAVRLLLIAAIRI